MGSAVSLCSLLRILNPFCLLVRTSAAQPRLLSPFLAFLSPLSQGGNAGEMELPTDVTSDNTLMPNLAIAYQQARN